MHVLRSRGRSTRRRAAILGSALALTAGVLVAAPTSALPLNQFEIDANIADAAGGGDDWAGLFDDTTGPAGSSIRFTGIVDDFFPGNDPTTFTGGHSKDDLFVEGADPSDPTDGWLHTSGSTPDKAEIENAFAAAYLAPDQPNGDADSLDDLILYFGADREAVNGSTNVGFWFTKQSIAPQAAGDFGPGVHENGDTLVLSEFTNGGGTPGVQVWQWDDGGAGPTCPSGLTAANVGCMDNDGTLRLKYLGVGNCDTAHACAVVNSGSISGVPWDYVPKAGKTPPNTYPAAAFIEGGVNISALSGGGQPCISNFLAETRSSPSIDAVLLDFVQSDFQVCGANIQITNPGVNEVGQAHTFTVTVNKSFAGSNSPATDAHVSFTLTPADGALPVVNNTLSTCDDAGDNVDNNGQCTIVFSSATAGTVVGSASATLTVGGQTFTPSTDGTNGSSGTVTKRFVDAEIDLSPLTDTNGITENHVVTITVMNDLGGAAGNVAATVGHVDVTLTATNGAVVSLNAGDTTCDVSATVHGAGADNLDGSGQCTVAFTSNSAGTVTTHATVSIPTSVTGLAGVLTRSSDGLLSNSADAVKIFKDGSINWIKHDDLGALLPGATFWVCKTQNWNSNTASYDNIADTTAGDGKANDSRCFVVADDVSAIDNPDVVPDANNTGGLFLLSNITLGTYTIQEKTAPDGYAIDPDEETVQINTTTTSAQPMHLVDNVLVPKPFIDRALFKVIVLTCNTTTEDLVVSSVDEAPADAGGVKDTLGQGSLSNADMEYLCGLGGATYDDKTRGTYRYDVTIPKP